MAFVASLADEMIGAAHMVGMAVGVANIRHRLIGPAAQGLQHAAAEGLKARVEQHQPVTGLEGHDMRKGFNERDAIAEFRQFHRRAVDEARAFVNVIVDEFRRQSQKIGHGISPQICLD